MNTFTSDLPFQSFETPTQSNGKQYFGYAGTFSQTIGYPNGSSSYINLIDVTHNTHSFIVDQTTFEEIHYRYQQINLSTTEYCFIWLEVDAMNVIVNWRLFKASMTLEQLYPIYQSAYCFESLYQLFEAVNALSVRPLKTFMRMVLADEKLMTAFVSIPASKHHHHSYPGGLLSHSLECALITYNSVSSLVEVSQNEKEVAIVAALLHDIGKIETLSIQEHTSMGKLLDHEKFTLSVLSPHLNELKQYWYKGYEVLVYLLSWKPSMGFCQYVVGNAIKNADQMSTSASLRRMAFSDKPDYFHFSKLQIGQKEAYLSRLV